jgi:hypothetical protein
VATDVEQMLDMVDELAAKSGSASRAIDGLIALCTTYEQMLVAAGVAPETVAKVRADALDDKLPTV